MRDGKKKLRGREKGRKEGREGGRQIERERRRRRVNITALCQANTRCWDTSQKKPPFIWERKSQQETEEGESLQGGRREAEGRESRGIESESIKH